MPGLPEPLTDLVGALLAKDPARRVSSALVLGSALANVRRSLGGPEALHEPGANFHTGPLPSQPGTSGVGAGRSGSGDDGGTVTLDEEAPGTSTVVDGASGLTLVDQAAVSERARLGGRGRRASRRAPRKEVSGQPGRHRRRRPGRWTSTVVAALLVAGLTLAAVLVHIPGTAPGTGRLGGGGGGSRSGPGLPVLSVVSVRELTQDGNEPNDNLGELPNVIGNNPGKYWQSDIYKSAEFGGSGGFGIVLQLNGRHVLHQLSVSTPMQGWSAEVFTSGSGSSTLSGWGRPWRNGPPSKVTPCSPWAARRPAGCCSGWSTPAPSAKRWCAGFR